MNANLSVTDPLFDQEVTIIVTLAASELSRDDRPVMVSVGVAEQLPVIKTGTFGELSTLIDVAWTTFGVRVQVDGAVQEVEPISEEQLVATASIEKDEPASLPQPHLSMPKPQVKNLSLF
jgi:hypothetical protein